MLEIYQFTCKGYLSWSGLIENLNALCYVSAQAKSHLKEL